MQPTSYSTDDLLTIIREQQLRIAALTWNDELGMLSSAGIREAIQNLPGGCYIVVFFDIDHLKKINAAVGNHFQVNRYLREGLRVRRGELIGQWLGDEIVAIIRERGTGGIRRSEVATPAAFIKRIQRQLGAVPLPSAVRCALGGSGLSATAAGMSGVRPTDMLQAIEWLSANVLAQKAQRDRGVA